MKNLLFKVAEPQTIIKRKLPKLCDCCGFETTIEEVGRKKYWACTENSCGYKELIPLNDKFYIRKEKEPKTISELKRLNIIE